MHINRRLFYLDWIPGQGVRIDYAAMIEILIQQLDMQRDSVVYYCLKGLISFQMTKSNNPLPSSGLQSF
jgi:hypothetical protein